jgi:hypothetical protein
MWHRFSTLLLAVSFSTLASAQTEEIQVVDPSDLPLVSITDAPSYDYPQRREQDGYSLVLHAPQIRSWPEFKRFDALMAIELTSPDGAAPALGTVTITGATQVDMARRMVVVTGHKINDVRFTGNAADEYEAVVESLATRKQLNIPLDYFLSQLAEDVLSDPPPPGFNTAPPVIHVASSPTLLLLIDGTPVLSDVADSGLKVVVNANWPVYQSASGSGPFYLLNKTLWLNAESLDSKWQPADSLPESFSKIPEGDEYAAVRAALPLKKSAEPVPKIIYTEKPAELIVTSGSPKLEEIADADGLNQVSNTESPLFKLDRTWYFLVAGRWFTTTNLDKGPWQYTPELPAAFSMIPEDSAMASVRASVPGTVEAKMAALEALLPTTQQVDRDAQPPVEITYAGDPQFEAIPATELSRAVNSGFDILQLGNEYYLCYSAIWYQSDSPVGPWTVAASVPDEIYAIPPSSPAYNVTQVTVAQSTPNTVVYSYPPAYTSSVYVVYGTPYYGTGWYYPPYIYGPYYYPYSGSYGHGSWYNPNTGGYGSRSVWYGPYGGYSYTQGYNGKTGRYGYAETAWDGDEWASHSEKYNPRTGISTETNRYYDADKNKSEMDRTVQRGDQEIKTERDANWGEGTSQTKRETSGGGSSNIKREYNDGTVSSSGTIKTGDGEEFKVEGEQNRQGGSATITGDDRSAQVDTQRNNGRSASTIEGSEGGKGVSVSGQGPGRTTVAESGSGDLYAGHNGDVYKKTDDGWQQHQDGDWNPVDTPDRPDREGMSFSEYAKQRDGAGGEGQQLGSGSYEQRAEQRSGSTYEQRAEKRSGGTFDQQAREQQQRQRQQGGSSGGNRDLSQLNRDHSARQRGNRQVQRRSGGFQRGGSQRRGGGGGRRRR